MNKHINGYHIFPLQSGYISVEFLPCPLPIAFKDMAYLKEDWRAYKAKFMKKKSMKPTIILKVRN